MNVFKVSDNLLFNGVEAVADAGGVEGFAREVIAETRWLIRQRNRRKAGHHRGGKR